MKAYQVIALLIGFSSIAIAIGISGHSELLKNILFPIFIFVWVYLMVRSSKDGNIPKPLVFITKVRSRSEAIIWGWLFLSVVICAYLIFLLR